MSQKLPVGAFKWVEETSQFNEDFIKNYNEDSGIGYFIGADVNILKNCTNFILIYTCCLKERKLKKLENL